MTVEKIATWIPVTDEAIVDYGIGTPEEQAAAAERIAVRRELWQQAWMQLPVWVRLHRRATFRWWGFRYRLNRAVRAFRNDD